MTDAPQQPGDQDFMVPDLGEGLEEVTIVSWSVVEGGSVAVNDALCVVETAKAEVEIPSPYAGTLTMCGGVEGETLAVGTLLARIRSATSPSDPGADEERTPTLVGYGMDRSLDRSRRADSRGGPPSAPVSAPPGRTSGRPRAKPPVRKLARELGVDLRALGPGSGPDGIVTRADVHAAAAAAAVPPLPASRGPARVGETPRATAVHGVRARAAQRLATSRAEIPDATCSVTADFTELLALRRALNAHLEVQGLAPTVTPFSLTCRFLVSALRKVPVLNATWRQDGPEILVHRRVHLGMAAATDRGLIVPVVRDADLRSTRELADEIDRLSRGARAGDLSPTELRGSTITVSNFGALDLDEGVPIINHPEAAIIGLGAVKPRPHVVDGDVVARPTGTITLAFDHRVCDGAEAGQFLSSLRTIVEQPHLALVDA